MQSAIAEFVADHAIVGDCAILNIISKCQNNECVQHGDENPSKLFAEWIGGGKYDEYPMYSTSTKIDSVWA